MLFLLSSLILTLVLSVGVYLFACADFYIEYLADPTSVWQRHLQRQRALVGDDTFVPAITPPLTTADMLLYFHSFMKRDDWGLVQVRYGLPRFGHTLTTH